MVCRRASLETQAYGPSTVTQRYPFAAISSWLIVGRADAKPAMIAASVSTIRTFMAGSWTILGGDQTHPVGRSARKVADARIGFCRILSRKGKGTPVRPLKHTIEFVPCDKVRTADPLCESVRTVSKFSWASALIFEEKTAAPSYLSARREPAVRPIFSWSAY